MLLYFQDCFFWLVLTAHGADYQGFFTTNIWVLLQIQSGIFVSFNAFQFHCLLYLFVIATSFRVGDLHVTIVKIFIFNK